MDNRMIAIFGCGVCGQQAISDIGEETVYCFIDNDKKKQGTMVCGKEVMSFADFIASGVDARIIVAVFNYDAITELLRINDIYDYEIYNPYHWKRVCELVEDLDGQEGKIAIVGVEPVSDMILSVLLSHGKAADDIVLTDCIKPDELNYAMKSLGFMGMKEALDSVDMAIISSVGRAYMLQSYINAEYNRIKVYNPFAITRYGDRSRLVVNPYEHLDHDISVSEWKDENNNEFARQNVQSYMRELDRQNALFDHVEIETYNRCNGVCNFCPVSRGNDTRTEMRMEDSLFYSIIDQLSEINYRGKLATFSNNEPFLDDRIVDFNRYAREKLPNARLHLFTNGTVLDLETFKSIIDFLDELIIDNYNQQLEIIPNVKSIIDYCNMNPQLMEKVTIYTRKPKEIRTSRGGDAPNREKSDYLADFGCVLPFKQMIIRPDGKVSLCCNDPLGKHTMGDLTKQSLMDVWNGTELNVARMAMLNGRKNYNGCRFCDAVLFF